MEKYDLKNLQLIAQGGEADIFDIGNDRVLRVLRNKSRKTLESEQVLFPILQKHHISVPHVYEYIEIEGRPAEVMQKIAGSTMLEQLMRHPLKINKEIKRFAGMHAQLLDIHSDCELNSIENVFNYFTSQSSNLDEKLISFTLKLIKELSIDNSICHGDFHPGNILSQDDTYYIIDWSGAYRSNFVSDIAHTYLLMTHVPKVPNQSRVQYAITKFFGSYIAKQYLKEIHKLKKFEESSFSKWTVVMSFLRVYYGLQSEKPARISYLNTCYELNEKGIDAATWCKYL